MVKNVKFVFIINPIAGTRAKNVFQEAIEKRFLSETCEVVYTQYSGHAREIAREKVKEGVENIVAVGGDGTVNEVASALVNSSCRLGIIPAGSGNGLARHLHIPFHLTAALDVIRNQKIRSIDAGQVNGRYFFCTCGTGFDALVGKKFARYGKRGMLNYIKATINQFIDYSPKSYLLKTGGKKTRLDAFMVTFANSGQFGNNAYIAPHAVIDDGLLDLCILRPFPKTSTLELGLRLFFKNIDQSPYLEVLQIKKASLKRRGKRKITIHIDGEPLTLKQKLKIKAVPGAIQVIVSEKNKQKGKDLLQTTGIRKSFNIHTKDSGDLSD